MKEKTRSDVDLISKDEWSKKETLLRSGQFEWLQMLNPKVKRWMVKNKSFAWSIPQSDLTAEKT